ncbi:hypothetical protein [Bradyrhizobium elkanii]|uniref:hypothetical protein n=1 Tax=Bradyrhizobium elkanii TaxID=29448 RepID=UPI00272C7266|nr:hypothetical protein [Bradyrhizobium elkanii]
MMLEPRDAELAFLTMPERGTFVLNVYFGGDDLVRAKITHQQLTRIIQTGLGPVLDVSLKQTPRSSGEAWQTLPTSRKGVTARALAWLQGASGCLSRSLKGRLRR